MPDARPRCLIAKSVYRALSVSPVALMLVLLPAMVSAHSAGQLDSRGCHDDRRRGAYHCHVGEYRGLTFRSKADLQSQIEAGKTVADMRTEQGKDPVEGTAVEDDEDEGWLSWVPFVGGNDSKMRDVGSGDVIVPRGIEERLRVLKDLHEKGLISDEEYAAKRSEILGDL
jgi:hypothetical protein